MPGLLFSFWNVRDGKSCYGAISAEDDLRSFALWTFNGGLSWSCADRNVDSSHTLASATILIEFICFCHILLLLLEGRGTEVPLSNNSLGDRNGCNSEIIQSGVAGARADTMVVVCKVDEVVVIDE